MEKIAVYICNALVVVSLCIFGAYIAEKYFISLPYSWIMLVGYIVGSVSINIADIIFKRE